MQYILTCDCKCESYSYISKSQSRRWFGIFVQPVVEIMQHDLCLLYLIRCTACCLKNILSALKGDCVPKSLSLHIASSHTSAWNGYLGASLLHRENTTFQRGFENMPKFMDRYSKIHRAFFQYYIS